MASNITMHLIEVSGIQRDLSSVALIYPSSNSTVLSQAQLIGCVRVDNVVNSATRDYIQLADLIPDNSKACDDSVDISQTKNMLEVLGCLTESEVPASLFRADLAFAAYRHLQAMRTSCTFPDTNRDQMISHPPPSPLSEAASSVPPWWSLVSILFHFILILLSLDIPESLDQVSRAFGTLQAVAAIFDSHLTREAIQNATMLIRLSHNGKERRRLLQLWRYGL